MQKSIIKDLIKVNKSRKQFMASSVPLKNPNETHYPELTSLTFSLDIFFYFSSEQPVCENMPGIFLGASICIIKFFQRIERLLKNERLVCRDCKKFLTLSYLSNKRTCHLFFSRSKFHPTCWFTCTYLIDWKFHPTHQYCR